MPLTCSTRLTRLACLALLGTALSGCNALTRLNSIGEAPPLTTIQDPQAQPGYKPISLPMPTPIPVEHRPNSLWQAGTRAFFKDQRASNVGDILTVVVNISEQAKLDNATSRARTGAESADMPTMMGLEKVAAKLVTQAASGGTAGPLASATSSGSSTGTGTIKRDEQINVRIAALVSQTLPNGNLVVVGKQEMRVNNELRELQVMGVVRPLDISATNEVSLDKLAEARVSYGGRGQITDVQQPRYGQQLFDIVFPF